MSKDTSNKKHPIQGSSVEQFMTMVWTLADTYGIEDISEDVYHHIELLNDAVGRYLFETSTKSPQKKASEDRKKFIAIFCERYQQLVDLPYNRNSISSAEGKMISQVNKRLRDKGFSVEEYLDWVFDTFLEENPKFRPPTIKSICSNFILGKFMTANEELREARKRKQKDEAAAKDLINRAKVLMRSDLPKEDNDKLKTTLKGFSEKNVAISELRQVVEELEKKHAEKIKKGE